jgi:hypothetical protein
LLSKIASANFLTAISSNVLLLILNSLRFLIFDKKLNKTSAESAFMSL